MKLQFAIEYNTKSGQYKIIAHSHEVLVENELENSFQIRKLDGKCKLGQATNGMKTTRFTTYNNFHMSFDRQFTYDKLNKNNNKE